MKKFRIFPWILCICLLFSAISVRADQSVSDPAAQGCYSLDAKRPLGGTQKLADTADAALLFELNTDTLVYSFNADGRIDPTGMVKLLTVLVALEKGALEDVVTVKRSTLNTVMIGSVSANLQAGEEISLKDLLYCIMVGSANDACAVVAEHIGGTQEAFAQMLDEKAAELGCTGSDFENAHGLSGTTQYSTARDLAKITAAGLENELFAQMFCAEDYTVPATNKSEERYIITTNYMMSDLYTSKHLDKRLTGGKTAAASLTDRSLICTAEVGTSRYLCVLMSAEAQVSADGFVVQRYGSFEETAAVLDYGFDNFRVCQVADRDQTFAQYPVSGGSNDVSVRVEQDIFTMLPVDMDPQLLSFQDVLDGSLLEAPIRAEQRVGSLVVSYDGIVLGVTPLTAIVAVAQEGTQIRPAPYQDAPQAVKFDYKGLLVKIGIVLVALLLLAALVLLIIRLVRTAKLRRLHRRRMRNRRRSR